MSEIEDKVTGEPTSSVEYYSEELVGRRCRVRVELKIDNKKIRYVTELQGFDPMSVICIETIQGGYLVWYWLS